MAEQRVGIREVAAGLGREHAADPGGVGGAERLRQTDAAPVAAIRGHARHGEGELLAHRVGLGRGADLRRGADGAHRAEQSQQGGAGKNGAPA